MLVEFNLYAHPNGRDMVGTVDAALEAFGLSQETATVYARNNQRLRVTAAQFGVFIVLRAGKVHCNQVSNLRAKLVPNNHRQKIIDLTGSDADECN